MNQNIDGGLKVDLVLDSETACSRIPGSPPIVVLVNKQTNISCNEIDILDLNVSKSVHEQYKALEVNTVSPETKFRVFDKEKIKSSIKETKEFMVQDTRFTRKCMSSDKILSLSQPYTGKNIGSDDDSEDYNDPDSADEMNYELLCDGDFDENRKVLSQEQRNTRCMKRNVEISVRLFPKYRLSMEIFE